jgi:hypothetical protein
MQKSTTQWIHYFADEKIEFIKNEEHISHLQVKLFEEKWRTKEEHIALLEETIRILKTDF